MKKAPLVKFCVQLFFWFAGHVVAKMEKFQNLGSGTYVLQITFIKFFSTVKVQFIMQA